MPFYIPETRVCVTAIIIGVPVGAQMEVLDCSKTGCPPARTRVAPTNHCPVTHGPLPADGGGMLHPATTYGPLNVVTGCPATMTRGNGAVGVA